MSSGGIPLTCGTLLFQDFVPGLSSNTHVKSIESNQGMTIQRATMLMIGLQNHPSVERLILGGTVGNQSHLLALIGEQLPNNTRLTSFSFGWYGADPGEPCEGSQEVMFEGLRNNATIQELDISHCQVPYVRVLQALANHPALVTLSLGAAASLSLAEIQRIGESLPGLRLKELFMSVTFSAGSPSAAAHQARCAIVNGIKNNFHLCQLGEKRVTFEKGGGGSSGIRS